MAPRAGGRAGGRAGARASVWEPARQCVRCVRGRGGEGRSRGAPLPTRTPPPRGRGRRDGQRPTAPTAPRRRSAGRSRPGPRRAHGRRRPGHRADRALAGFPRLLSPRGVGAGGWAPARQDAGSAATLASEERKGPRGASRRAQPAPPQTPQPQPPPPPPPRPASHSEWQLILGRSPAPGPASGRSGPGSGRCESPDWPRHSTPGFQGLVAPSE